ncbi:C40 family peptidase [Rhodoligotrophos defluvii]|uniref:C40 family peptidase n=1 Tax=Rhodoligotrophos defluvii TaxID=2561934 RepID=UPI0010C9890E|nr:NlpC/P60 family protein [Rhodoligotrophos defluvii]
MTVLDRRITPFRSDLAADWLKGTVEAARFVAPTLMRVSVPALGMRASPRFDAPHTTEALMGEAVRVFEITEGWAWAQLVDDGYVGYLPSEGLAADEGEPTHRVTAPCTTLYPAPNIKTQPTLTVSLGARLRATGEADGFVRTASGMFAFAKHVRPVGETVSDFVSVAERFLGAPYVWGGRQWTGIDCSGLVQVALQAQGAPCPRDSDMQEASLGRPLDPRDLAKLRRGDLVFWPGHVGIMADAETLLHATGHYMQVVLEPLREAVERIRQQGTEVRSIRRL